MKIGLILLLVAGPFVVRAQKLGTLNPNKPLDSLLSPWQPPVVQIPNRQTWWGPKTIYDDHWYTPFPENLHWDGKKDEQTLTTLYARNSMRILLPDRMPCLVPMRIFDNMPRKMRFCCDVDKMPNGYRE